MLSYAATLNAEIVCRRELFPSAGAIGLYNRLYFSESYRWARFEREWDEALTAYSIDHFLMKDFAAKKGYEHWPEKKRVKFLRTLQHIIKSNTEKDSL